MEINEEFAADLIVSHSFVLLNGDWVSEEWTGCNEMPLDIMLFEPPAHWLGGVRIAIQIVADEVVGASERIRGSRAFTLIWENHLNITAK